MNISREKNKSFTKWHKKQIFKDKNVNPLQGNMSFVLLVVPFLINNNLVLASL
jgi:hypothetical protein